jgi:hypothetical protein
MILLVAYQLLVRQDRPVVRTGVLLGLLIAVQLLLEEEVLAIVMLALLVGVAFGAIIYRREARPRARHAAIGVGIAAVVSLVMCAVPLYYQFFGAYRPTREFAQTVAAKADVASLVRPSKPGGAAVAAAAAQLTGCRPRAVSDVVMCAVRQAGAG